MEQLLGAWCITYLSTLFNPYNNLRGEYSYYSLYADEETSLQKLGNLYQVIQLGNARVRIQSRICVAPKTMLFQLYDSI